MRSNIRLNLGLITPALNAIYVQALRTNHLRYVSCRFKMRSEKKPRILNFYAVVTVSRTVQAVHNFASYKINKAHKNQAKRDNVEDTYSAIYIEINIHHNVI